MELIGLLFIGIPVTIIALFVLLKAREYDKK